MVEAQYLGIPVPPLPEHTLPPTEPILDKQEYIYFKLQTTLQQLVSSLTSSETVQMSEPPKEIEADYAFATHPLARTLRRSPADIATSLSETINSGGRPDLIAIVSAQNGFLNFSIDTNPYGEQVLKEIEDYKADYGRQNTGNGKTIVIDCSSPNVAKFMSVGHLRSTIIGESLARINQATGHKVIRDNHLGDWGTQFGMLARAHELWNDEYEELRDGGDSVKGLYKLYVRIHEEVEKEKEAERIKLDDPNAEVESNLEKEGRDWFRRLESGNDKALDLLKWATEQSLTEFQRVYDLLGTKYEYMLGESFYIPMLPDILNFLKDKGIARPDDNGALTVDLEAQKLPRLVVQKSDGTSLYSTRDLATLIARTAWFDPQRILYVVGGDQREYFQQVFATFDQMTEGIQKPETEHISFGMITLPEGKMSTRAGRVVFLEEVLDEAITRAKAKTEEVSRDNLTIEEKDDIARKVGVGAVVFFDLGQGRERNIQFDWDKALSFEGYSAPYIQYAHARAEALLRRASEQKISIDVDTPPIFDQPSEISLIKHLSKFPESVAKAGLLNRPDIIAQYIYAAATRFSEFYRDVSVINEADLNTRNTRLRITQATAQVIKNGLALLCIEAPNRM